MAPGIDDLYLVWLDCQVVEIDDPRVMYTVTGDVRGGRLVDLRYSARPGSPFLDRFGELLAEGMDSRDAADRAADEDLPGPTHEVTQRDIRSIAAVSLIRNWAAVGRDFQEDLQRHAATLGLTYEYGYMPRGLDPDSGTDPVDLAERLVRESGILDRLFDSHEHALSAVRESFSKLTSAPRRKRRSADEAEVLLRRVAEEYKAAIERGVRAPRQAVADRLQYHTTHVGRLLAQARALGMLPATKPRGIRRFDKTEASEDAR